MTIFSFLKIEWTQLRHWCQFLIVANARGNKLERLYLVSPMFVRQECSREEYSPIIGLIKLA